MNNTDQRIEPLEFAKIIKMVFENLKKNDQEYQKYGDDFTNLKLQKLMWFCCINYLRETKSRLINENFYAWQYGPVLLPVYEKYKNLGSDLILDYSDKTTKKEYVRCTEL